MCALFTLSQGLFCVFSLGDVEKSNNGANGLALPYERVRPVLDGKTATVFSPKNIVINVHASIFEESLKYRTVVDGKGCAVLSGMVLEVMHVLTQ
jgi:hypothetical protein